MRLREQGRPATREEQRLFARYVGWGGLPQAFDHRNPEWRKEFVELGSVLGKEDYERARRSTQDAHYTAQVVVNGIYNGLRRLGFTGGRVLEPSAGTGHFIGLMPPDLRQTSGFTAIELDSTTSEMARHLYPGSTHINRGFQDVVIPAGHFDAVVGNPPFGSQTLYDPQHRDLSGLSIHNFFIAKSMDKLRPGGLMAVVVSRYFLDAIDATARERIARQAHLLAAIRLPNTAFKRNALTEVTTDILFFRKAEAGERPDVAWTRTGETRDPLTGEAITISDYFIQHPEQMAGRMSVTRKMHRDGVDLVPIDGEELADALEQRIAALPEGVYRAAPAPGADGRRGKPALELPDTLKVGAFFVTPDGKLARRLPDHIGEADYAFIETRGERAEARIRGMVSLRDTLRTLMSAEQSALATNAELDRLRQALNHVYDEFVDRQGFLTSQANRLAMAEDPEYPLLLALENEYDKGVSADAARRLGGEPRVASAKKADIFSRRVMSPRQNVERVDNAKDALVVSMNESGRVNLPRMVQLTGLDEDELVEQLRGRIFHDPVADAWRTADEYLTGNVARKLREAQEAAAEDARYAENVTALEHVQPAPIQPVDISVQLGSSWVPDTVVDNFVTHLLGDVRRRISYQPSLGKWLAKIGPAERTLGTVTWGTEAAPANELLEAILTNASIQVRVSGGRDQNGNPVYRTDEVQTAAANQKADEIRQAFLDWIWEDQPRREWLASIYNKTFNTNVPARYDGSHLQLPGSSIGVTLRPSQKDAIWRGIQEGTALYDHVVGAGKTYVLVGVVMESRRMGLLRKPMLAVPNHLLLQWKDAFYALYPNANVLVAEKADFQKGSRERLFARIATGDWDAVIVGHSSFKKIGMPDDTLTDILEEQVRDLATAIARLKNSDGDRVTIKEMEKAKDRMRERLERKADTGAKDKAVSFADLGVDALLVDEAHEFKNLFITTSLNRVAGLGNLAGSERAFDMFVKCRYLQGKHGGRGVFFATGTPISNTLAELYTMQRYLQYDELKARGIVHFDSWASTFGQVVSGWELDATGVNYRLNSRFARFQNVPELTALYRSFADVVTKADLDERARALGQRFPVPKVAGGKPENVVVERSPDQARYMGIQEPVLDDQGQPTVRADGSTIKSWSTGSVIWRMENLPKDPSIDNPLKVTNDARKAGLDFRLIDPAAVDFEGSKVNVAVCRIFEIWERWKEDHGTQLVFCDLSTPKAKGSPERTGVPTLQRDDAIDEDAQKEGGEEASVSMDELLAGRSSFSVYDDMREKLIALGVPPQEIRFIHEASTDLQKARLFQQMNRGEVRILFASTAKAGAGTNVQRRLVAEHHLDVPWRPSDLEQREGRIVRQGNLFYERDPDGFEVEILRYATKQSYDSRMWQAIEHKASGIEQFRRGDVLQRVIEDVAGEAANAAEMKAAATGNPLIFQQVKLSADLRKLEALFANHKRGLHALEGRLAWLLEADRRADQAARMWSAEIGRREPLPAGQAGVFRTLFATRGSDDRDGLLADVTSAMRQAIELRTRPGIGSGQAERVQVGWYRGFEVHVCALRDQLQFSVHGEAAHEPDNLWYRADESFSAAGFVQRLDNFLQRFERFSAEVEAKRQREKEECARAQEELGKPFAKRIELEDLRADVREVMAELKKMQADDGYVSTWLPRSERAGGDRQRDNKADTRSVARHVLT